MIIPSVCGKQKKSGKKAMPEIRVAIHQPNFFPWLGYFYKIAKSDVFVFLDGVNYPKSGNSMSCFCNRTKVMNEDGPGYFSHAVERESGPQPIKTVVISQSVVLEEKLNALLTLYKNAPFFDEIVGLLKDIYGFSCSYISDFNINGIVKICDFLNIDTKFYRQSNFNLKTSSSELLRDLVYATNGNCYLAGSGGSKKYLNVNLFKEGGIKVNFISYPDFPHKHFNLNLPQERLSIIDVLMNCGKTNTADVLKK